MIDQQPAANTVDRYAVDERSRTTLHPNSPIWHLALRRQQQVAHAAIVRDPVGQGTTHHLVEADRTPAGTRSRLDHPSARIGEIGDQRTGTSVSRIERIANRPLPLNHDMRRQHQSGGNAIMHLRRRQPDDPAATQTGMIER